MARFELEAVVKNGGKASAGLKEISAALGTLQSNYDRVQTEMRKAAQTSRELESELVSLNRQYKAGTLTEQQYANETTDVKIALDSTRASLGTYQRQLVSLDATIKQTTSGADQYGKSVNRLKGYHDSFSGGIRSSNSVAIEFGRIIQDAPYGIQGVANNLQQLTTNFGYYAQSAKEAAAQQGNTLTKMQLLKGAFAGIISPVNLLTIGVSLLTAGWVLYQKWAQSSKKATEEQTKALNKQKTALDDYISTLDSQSKAQAGAASSYGQEIALLDQLYTTVQKSVLARNEQYKAIAELQRLYPQEFGNLTQAEFLAGKAAAAYFNLRDGIVASAVAVSAQKLAGEATDQYVKALVAEAGAQTKAQQSLDKLNETKRVLAVIEEKQRTGTKDLSGEILRLRAIRNREVTQTIKDIATLNEYRDNIVTTSIEVEKFNKVARDAFAKAPQDTGLLTELRQQSKALEERIKAADSEAEIKSLNEELQKTNDEISRISKLGIVVNETVKKTKESVKKVADEAQKVTLSPLEQSIKNSLDDLNKVQSQLNKIYRANEFDPFGGGAFRRPVQNSATSSGFSYYQQAMRESSRGGEGLADTEKEMNRIMSRSVQRFGREFYDIVSDLGQYSEDTFRGAIGDIVSRLSSSFNDVFTSVLGGQLKDKIKLGLDDIKFGGLSNKISQSIVAGAGIAGGIISGATKPTSSVGQGVGGALAGAAAGLALGPIGAVVGGLIGAIGGLFGASSARKREREIMEKQLEEARKQTELLRKSALAYTTSIIGQMTNQGIVTGVDRNEFGDIVFRIEGQDLVGVLNRADVAKGRGR